MKRKYKVKVVFDMYYYGHEIYKITYTNHMVLANWKILRKFSSNEGGYMVDALFLNKKAACNFVEKIKTIESLNNFIASEDKKLKDNALLAAYRQTAVVYNFNTKKDEEIR